jgi:tetraacyldisaccharide 4'-kinase
MWCKCEVLLRPLSCLYGGIAALRNYFYDSGIKTVFRSDLPVISVGNLTAGGNGKTPLVIAISQILLSENYTPAILMRGYGGIEKGPYRVAVDDSPSRVGDEALLLARTLGVVVVVSRSRREGLKWLQRHGGVDVVILDDGFQHRAVARDLDIVSHYLGSDDAKSEFLAGKILPEGMFREDRDRGLQRSGAIVFSSRSLQRIVPDKAIEEKVPSNQQIFYSYLKVSGIAVWKNGKRVVIAPEEFKNDEIIGICGLGNPQAFRETLSSISGSIGGFYAYPDHYQFTRSDVEQLVHRYPSQTILSTSKDMVKLHPLILEHASDSAARWGEVLITTEVVPEEKFSALIKGVVKRRSRVDL